MAIMYVQADFFELKGAARITYDLSSGMLHYRGPTRPPQRDFVDISQTVPPLDTPIGRLVTAVLQSVADGDSSSVTILLPEVNLPQGDEQAETVQAQFETVAIFTTSRSTIGGPGLVDGPIELYTHVPMDGTARLGNPGRPCAFSASLNRGVLGPGAGPGLLRVEGECTFGTTGYKVNLVRREPQGMSSRDLLLDLIVTPPPRNAVVGQALTKYPVAYEEETKTNLETVTILPDGPSIEVEIIT